MEENQIVIYTAPKGEIYIEAHVKDESIWLTQAQMAKLFDKDRDTISEHIQNVYREQELEKVATTRKFRVVQNENGREVKRSIEHYNLDVIISVGYRVKSKQGTQFRIWANKVLRSYLIKGYAINEKLLREQNKRLEEIKSTILMIGDKSIAPTASSN